MHTFQQFLKSTKWISRILILLWIYGAFFSPFARSQHSWVEYFLGVIIYSILFLGPAFVIEIYKNPVLKQFRKQKGGKQEIASKEKPQKISPPPSQIIAGILFVLFGLPFLFAFLVPIFALIDNEFFAASDPNSVPVALLVSTCMGVGGVLAVVFGIRFLRGHYADTAISKKLARAKKKELILQQKEYERRMAPYRGIHLSEQEIRNIEKEISLPNIEYVPIILSPKEIAVYRANASIAETKSRVVGRTGSYGGGSVRIAKGFSIHTGGSKSQPIYGEVTTQFGGELFITTERVVFLGEQKGFDLPIRKITAFFVSGGRLKIQSGQRVFEVIISAPYLAQTVFEVVSTGSIPIENSSDVSDNYMEVEDESEQTDDDPIYVNDELFEDAVDIILEHGQASTSLLQRYLKINYSHAARLMDELEAHEIVGAAVGSKLREILISEEEWEDMRLSIILDEGKGAHDFSKSAEEQEDISRVDGMEGHEFEYFCASLLRKNGFTNVEVTPGSGDQGVDILAEKGGVKYAIQCKNYASPLSNTPVQEVSAGKIFYGCHVGVVMTNSTFTPGAKELAKATGILLWDRTIVQELIKEKNKS